MGTVVKTKSKSSNRNRNRNGDGKTSRGPNDTDRIVGENVRQLRLERGYTLAEIASSLGISHQQLQKYETASNRISAGMLFELSKLLWVPVESFFQQGSTTGKKKEVSDSEDLRRECRFWVERTSSAKTLKDMAVVLEALSAEPGLRR